MLKRDDLMTLIHVMSDEDQVVFLQAQENIQKGVQAMEQLIVRLCRKVEHDQTEISFLKQQLVEVQKPFNEEVYEAMEANPGVGPESGLHLCPQGK